MGKKAYFVDIASQEISEIPFDQKTTFKINATNDEVQLLRDKLNGMAYGDGLTFGRAHIPIYPYHNDKGNDIYDDHMMQAYQLMYEWGDELTQSHIESMNILPEK